MGALVGTFVGTFVLEHSRNRPKELRRAEATVQETGQRTGANLLSQGPLTSLMNTVGLSSCSVFLQICLAFLLRELAEIDKQLDQQTQENAAFVGSLWVCLKGAIRFTQGRLHNPARISLLKWKKFVLAVSIGASEVWELRSDNG